MVNDNAESSIFEFGSKIMDGVSNKTSKKTPFNEIGELLMAVVVNDVITEVKEKVDMKLIEKYESR